MPGRFDNSLVSRIQQAVDIVDVVSEHLNLDRKGKEYVGLCPFHQDHKPSLYVNPVKQIFKCFACGAGGDVFKFLQLRENLTFPEAIQRLADRAGIKVKPMTSKTRHRDGTSAEQLDPRKLAKANAWAQASWQMNLDDEHKGAKVRDYIAERKITVESMKQWGLGYAVDSWDDFLKSARKKKVPERFLVDAGFAVERDSGDYYDKFRDRLMFPINDVTGRVIGFGGRTLGSDPAKYMNSPTTSLFDKSNCLYGLDRARHEVVSTGTAIVVEGYTDVIMCHQFGITNVVATLGTSFTTGHARILRRYAKRIVLVFDNDIAGTEAANRALEVCLSQRIDIKMAFVPQGADPCDFVLAAGADQFRQMVTDAVDVMEFKWARLTERLDSSDNLTDKRAITEEYLRTVASAMETGRVDPIAMGLIGMKLSKITGLGEEHTRTALAEMRRRISRGDSFVSKNQMVVSVNLGEGYYVKAQQEILEILLNEPKLFDKAAKRLEREVFKVPIMRQIAEVLFDLLENGDELRLATVLAQVESTEAGSLVVELADSGEKKGNFAERLDGALDAIEMHAVDQRADEIKASLAYGDTRSLYEIQRLLKEKNNRSCIT